MDDCLVYFFTGFLDSGKTSVICSWIGGENFKNRKVVVINTEEGEEEYDEDDLQDDTKKFQHKNLRNGSCLNIPCPAPPAVVYQEKHLYFRGFWLLQKLQKSPRLFS